MAASLIVSTTPRFQLTALKDGVVWDLTLATVSLFLRKPDGTVLSKEATVNNALAGQARYDAVIDDLDQAGLWTRSWRVTENFVVLESPPISFAVQDSPW